ncbi:peptidase S41 [Erythrobacter litoralis]|uniref:S41 family peptidase n=1 Tax=Erythrobacter litoralis TaxID=39960 RepID=UPI0024351A41|nr:S41 family peptidase [Erythrobacter litoralis]MDG6078915.1 peptidase S41 [Erythrobacter litoralis]
MSKFRTILSATLAVALTACGGGGGSGSTGGTIGGGNTGGGGGSGGGGTGGSAADCSIGARKDWVLGQMREWYLFPDLLNTGINQASYDTVQDYIDALVAPARAQERDRFFTYITSIEEENDLIRTGSNAGFGVRLSYDQGAGRLFVVEAFESAPAFAAGVDRGTEILAIDGQTVSSLFAQGGSFAVSNALGPSDPGVSRALRIRTVGGVERTVTIQKTEYSLDPVSDRYGAKILDVDGKRVGYINLRTFIIQSAEQDLREAFQRFQNQNVDQVILDLRYNGGGLISIADLLGDLLSADKTGQVFSRTVFRPSKSENNETTLFSSQPQAISATKIAVIGREGTASASELVTNSMLAYLDENIGLIGTNTFGKPVGQIALDRSACDDRLRVVALQTENADGEGEYYRGLASVMQATCAADDQLTRQLGDPSEESISTALDYLAGRTCRPITVTATKKGVTAQAVPRRELLLSARPSAAQSEIPGLF